MDMFLFLFSTMERLKINRYLEGNPLNGISNSLLKMNYNRKHIISDDIFNRIKTVQIRLASYSETGNSYWVKPLVF